MPRSPLNASRPRWTHDCKACRFLGRFDYAESPTDPRWHYDLYYCPKSSGGTVLARWGQQGPQYTSLILTLIVGLGVSSEPLKEAARRQIQRWQQQEEGLRCQE